MGDAKSRFGQFTTSYSQGSSESSEIEKKRGEYNYIARHHRAAAYGCTLKAKLNLRARPWCGVDDHAHFNPRYNQAENFSPYGIRESRLGTN